MLHVIPSMSEADGGPTRALQMMESALGRAGVEVTTLTTDHGLRSPEGGTVAEGRGARRVHARLWFRHYKVAPGMAVWLLRNVRSYDVVHIHALFSFSSTVAAWIARQAGVPYVLRPLGALAPWGRLNRRPLLKRLSIRLIEGPNLRHSAAVHFTSDDELQEARDIGVPMKGIVIPLGVEIEPRPQAARDAESTAARRTVLFLSRLDPKKNVESLLDAFAGSTDLRKGARLAIAGAGDPAYVRSLKDRAAASGVAEIVTWLGHVGGRDKCAAYAQADLYVLPSRSENFGIAPVEAMLQGLPCILSPGVAVAKEAASAQAAVLSAPEPAELARAIETLLADANRRRLLGARAKAFARERWSPDVMARRLYDLYEAVRLKGPGRTA